MRRGALFWTISVRFCIEHPMPLPTTSMPRPVYQYGEVSVIRERRNSPTMVVAAPMIG